MKVYTLENWSVTDGFEEPNPYIPPEHQAKSLHGNVFGHVKFPDGHEITTSVIVKVENGLVYTYSGSIYKLGTPNQGYIEWCKQQGCYIPTPEEPFKIRIRNEG